MAFHGLFIGIDQYRSPRISNLTCAARDASALYGLFADTFGEANSVLLLDEQGTNDAIRRQFEDRLSRVGLDDVVVVAFSGHGSDSHRLITYDADPSYLAASTIRLDELTTLFARIPARNVILILDCCFAGGAGAKVFHEDVATKGLKSVSEILGHISGMGRVILTAAKPDQEAIEDRRRGHGLLTFHLLEGLRGAPEIVANGRIPLLSLIDFVTRMVIESAKQIRHNQEPGMRGTLDGDVTLPILKAGPIYSRLLPETPDVKVGANVDELAAYGFSSRLLQIWKGSIPGLNSLQQAAINDFGLLKGNHIVVSAPTSSGKTMVGELAALHTFLRRQRTYFLLPLRALVNDKYEEFSRKYGSYGLRVIRSTGEIADDNEALVRGKFDIALLTYEKFAALILGSPHLLRQVGLVVIDEVQMIADKNRGAALEFLLTLLRSQRTLGTEPQVIALSAVIGDSNGLENWLDARLLRSEERPVPLEEGIIDAGGAYRFINPEGEEKRFANYVSPEYRKGSYQDIIVPLVRKLVGSGEKVIVFRETKPIVQSTARYLRQSLGLAPAEATISSLPAGDVSAASQLLRECLAGGVAFHNADLDREERRVIEESFRDPASNLKVLVSTTTLAMGVNTPAWSVVIAGLEHPDGPYSVAEYKNMVGRAGRLGFSPLGKSFLVATSMAETDQYWENYVRARPENLESRFAAHDPLSLICRVLATAAAARLPLMTQEDILEFIESSFAAYQLNYRVGAALWSREQLSEAVAQLSQHRLVREEPDGYQLTELGRVAGEAGVEVKSVLRLVEALSGIGQADFTVATCVAAAQVTEEVDNVLFPIHKKSRQEQSRWQAAVRQQRITDQTMRTLQSTAVDEAHYTLRCKKIASTLMWIQGTELMNIEQSLLRHLPAENAAGPIRAVAERTRDLIPVVARVGEILIGKSLGSLIDNLVVRLELGIPAGAVPLGQILHRFLERADYLALARANLLTPEAIKAASEEELLDVISAPAKVQALKKVAESLSVVPVAADEDFKMPAVEMA
jgi:replicative superfamily II helicase